MQYSLKYVYIIIEEQRMDIGRITVICTNAINFVKGPKSQYVSFCENKTVYNLSGDSN